MGFAPRNSVSIRMPSETTGFAPREAASIRYTAASSAPIRQRCSSSAACTAPISSIVGDVSVLTPSPEAARLIKRSNTSSARTLSGTIFCSSAIAIRIDFVSVFQAGNTRFGMRTVCADIRGLHQYNAEYNDFSLDMARRNDRCAQFAHGLSGRPRDLSRSVAVFLSTRYVRQLISVHRGV